MITIKPFKVGYQKEIDMMLMEISKEFEATIFSNGKSSQANAFDKYWVAFHREELIGTISILKMESGCCILKNMFVKKEFRGKKFNASHKLLLKVFNWCKSENINSIYLGTMEQFVAAHKFYEKNGFQEIAKSELPESFIQNPLDSVFYKVII